MARTANTPNNGKLTSAHRSAVRAMLATGATLAMLISAQGFANNAQAAVTTSAVQTSNTALTSTMQTTSTTEENESSVALVSSRQPTTIFSTVTQPNPGTRSSR